MTLQAVRMCFDQGRAVSSTGTSNRCGHCLIHHFGIETVARHAGHFVTRSSFGDARHCSTCRERRMLGVLVVLAEENNRKFPTRLHVDRFRTEELTLGTEWV